MTEILKPEKVKVCDYDHACDDIMFCGGCRDEGYNKAIDEYEKYHDQEKKRWKRKNVLLNVEIDGLGSELLNLQQQRIELNIELKRGNK